METGAWRYDWTTLSLEKINTGTWASKLGVGLRLTTSLLKKIVVKSEEMKTGSDLGQNLLRTAMTQK
jgi:hypothetical protein